MESILLRNTTTNDLVKCDLYIGNVPQTVWVGPTDGEHRGYTSLEELAKDWEIVIEEDK